MDKDSSACASRRCVAEADQTGNWHLPNDGSEDDRVPSPARLSKREGVRSTQTGAVSGLDRPNRKGRPGAAQEPTTQYQTDTGILEGKSRLYRRTYKHRELRAASTPSHCEHV